MGDEFLERHPVGEVGKLAERDRAVVLGRVLAVPGEFFEPGPRQGEESPADAVVRIWVTRIDVKYREHIPVAVVELARREPRAGLPDRRLHLDPQARHITSTSSVPRNAWLATEGRRNHCLDVQTEHHGASAMNAASEGQGEGDHERVADDQSVEVV